MAEYVPIKTAGIATTHTAATALTGGRLVAISGNDTITEATTNTPSWIGVAAQDASAGDRVTVFSGGVQELTATGSVAPGDQVLPAANGTVSTWTPGDATNARSIVGLALTAGPKVRVKLER
jgi:predicted RecA/RadA family phage recombinase